MSLVRSRALLAAVLALSLTPAVAAETAGPKAVPARLGAPPLSVAAPRIPIAAQGAGPAAQAELGNPAKIPAPAAPAAAAAGLSAEIPAEAPAGVEAGAERARPASLLDSLRADIPLLAPRGAGIEAQKALAETSFQLKAGGAAPIAASARRAGGSGRGSSGGGDDGGGPDYPRDRVFFDGREYPSTAFRPNVEVEPLLIQAIDSAKKSLHIALYEFKLGGVLEALRNAVARGVDVRIVLDYSQVYPQPEEGADYRPRRSNEIWALLREEKFQGRVKVLRGLGQYGINHNKFVVVDGEQKRSLAEYGSYNWSYTAEHSHYENANFTADRGDVDALLSYWRYLDGVAQPVQKTVPGRDGETVVTKTADEFSWPDRVPPPPLTAAAVRFNDLLLPPFVFSPTDVPGQSAEDWLVAAIDRSRESIDLSIFALRSTRIAEALLRAHQRRPAVRVRVVMDESQSASEPFGPYAQWLAANGIEVFTLSGPDPNSDFPLAQKNHNKFGIFDGKLVETGSANYTKYAAAANFENARFSTAGATAAAFQFYFKHLLSRAKRFAPPERAPTLPTDQELVAEQRRAPRPRPDPVPPPGPAPNVGPRMLAFNEARLPSYVFRDDTAVEPLLVSAIKSARKSIRLALYEFNLDGILDALREAKANGRKIEIVLDRSHVYTTGRDHTGQPRKPSAQIQALINEGFDVLILKGQASGIQHNKYAIFDAEDGGLVEFGSYNWAVTAERHHFENVKFSADAHDVADFLAYFNYKRALAQPVDHDKLDEVLERGLADDVEGAEPAARGDSVPGEESDRTSKLPKPPASTAPLIEFNGEKFYRHYFSPQGGIEDAWVRAVLAARESIEIAMFSFYSKAIADAIVQARALRPDLKIKLLLDAGQSKLARIEDTPVADWFTERGFDVTLLAGPNQDGDPFFEKQHNKFLIVDGRLLLTGSFNLSPTAENFSFENENLVDDPTDLAGYVDFFARMLKRGWAARKPKDAASVKPLIHPGV